LQVPELQQWEGGTGDIAAKAGKHPIYNAVIKPCITNFNIKLSFFDLFILQNATLTSFLWGKREKGNCHFYLEVIGLTFLFLKLWFPSFSVAAEPRRTFETLL